MAAHCGTRRHTALELVNDASRYLGIVLMRAEEPRADHVGLQADAESFVAGIEIDSTAGYESEGVLAAKRRLRQKFCSAPHAVRPYVNLPRNFQPVADSSHSHCDSGVNATLRREGGSKLAVAREMAAVGVVDERHIETV